MKKFLFVLFAVVLTASSACRKETETAPDPLVVGKWQVAPAWIDPVTNTFRPDVPTGLPYELELFASETGFRRDFLGESSFEWDLIDGDMGIVFTRRRVIDSDTVFVAEFFEIRNQQEFSALWISPWTYRDSASNATLQQHLFLTKIE